MSPFTTQSSDSVSSLGETRLIAAIRKWLGKSSPRTPFGIGDDCAVMPRGRAAQLLTVDPVIYGEHFDDSITPYNVGKKLFKRNLSDIAAMGGKPRAAVVALAIDQSVRIQWLKDFYRGLASISRTYRVPIVGGDVAHHRGGIVATLTLVGEASGDRIITRQGARINDILYVTGFLGNTLTSGHHYNFSPRLEEGEWLAKRAEVMAMMDVSDGLAKDLHSLTPAHAIPALEERKIPRRSGCPMESALCCGEDYELLIVVDGRSDLKCFEQTWKRRFPKTRLTRIGRFVAARSKPENALDLTQFKGYEHLR